MLNASGHGFVGPDQLMNLYSDPDTNGQIPEFKIDHKPPGKKDYAFNLAVAGKEPAEPGKYPPCGRLISLPRPIEPAGALESEPGPSR